METQTKKNWGFNNSKIWSDNLYWPIKCILTHKWPRLQAKNLSMTFHCLVSLFCSVHVVLSGLSGFAIIMLGKSLRRPKGCVIGDRGSGLLAIAELAIAQIMVLNM